MFDTLTSWCDYLFHILLSTDDYKGVTKSLHQI